MSEETGSSAPETLVNDAITADDAGFKTDAGNQEIKETQIEVSEEGSDLEESSVESETVEEFQDEVQEAIDNGATEEEVANMVKEFKLKVNGKEVTKTIDLSDEDALKRELQLAAAGQSAMQRSRELEKLFEQELKRLQEHPFEFLKELGMDPDDLSEKHLRSKLAELEKSPEQREREQMQKELEEARLRLKQAEEEAKSAKFQAMVEEQSVQLENDIMEALDSHQTLPKSPKTVGRIADAMSWALENGYPDVTVNDVIPSVEAEIRRELDGFMSELPEDLLESYIGKKNLERLRKKRLSTGKQQVGSVNSVKPTISKEANLNTDNKIKKKLRAKDYFKNLGI